MAVKPPRSPRPFDLLFRDAQASSDNLIHLLGSEHTPETYLHWDQLLRRPPPAGLTHEEWWVSIKFRREGASRPIPLLQGRAGRPFVYSTPDPIPQRLQRIDRDASGALLFPEETVSSGQRNRYIVSSLIEESITSSQLEGAATTRRVAKDMIRSGRAPITKDERMILNNYRAMQWVREQTATPLTPQTILDLHQLLGEDALDAGEPGRLRGPDPDDTFGVWSGGVRLHRPPDHSELEARLERMCAFANADADGPFMHPVLRAITLHFWLAYDHPFEDGNGRTARSLFYWYLLRDGYWLFEYVSISSVIKKAYAKYARAFLYTETDANDLTYFFLFHLDVIDQAVQEVQAHLQRKVREVRQARALLQPGSGLNHRQLALLTRAVRHPGETYTIASHRRSHAVTYDTARTDLLALAERDLLTKRKEGRRFVFASPADLSQRLESVQRQG